MWRKIRGLNDANGKKLFPTNSQKVLTTFVLVHPQQKTFEGIFNYNYKIIIYTLGLVFYIFFIFLKTIKYES